VTSLKSGLVAGPPDVHYSSSLHGGRHQLSMLVSVNNLWSLSLSPFSSFFVFPGDKLLFFSSFQEADPLRPDMSRYPYPRLDASFPVASSRLFSANLQSSCHSYR